jgi:hypothetical protein
MERGWRNESRIFRETEPRLLGWTRIHTIRSDDTGECAEYYNPLAQTSEGAYRGRVFVCVYRVSVCACI